MKTVFDVELYQSVTSGLIAILMAVGMLLRDEINDFGLCSLAVVVSLLVI